MFANKKWINQANIYNQIEPTMHTPIGASMKNTPLSVTADYTYNILLNFL